MDKPKLDIAKAASRLFSDKPAAAYTQGEGTVRYLDGTTLSRPLDLPKKRWPIALGIAAVAAVIGIFFAVNVLGSTLHAAERAAASVEENLARDVSLDLPLVSDYAGLDAASIKSAVEGLGYTVYTASSDDDIAAGKLDMVKLPSDVTIEEGALFYLQGIDNLDAPDAALLLNGSWRLQFDSSKGFNLSVRYADFDSGNVDDAVAAAIQAEGFDADSATDLDVDDVGNTYRSGTLDVGGATYNWRVSAIALSSVYEISGLPDTAIYVGIRITAA